jgi:hypothetical protein
MVYVHTPQMGQKGSCTIVRTRPSMLAKVLFFALPTFRSCFKIRQFDSLFLGLQAKKVLDRANFLADFQCFCFKALY